jgi:hypothetical protein
VPRHPGLVDVHPRDEVVDGLLAREQGLDDLEATRIGQGLKDSSLHLHAYALLRICMEVSSGRTGIQYAH